MKRISLIFLSFLLFISLCACGESEPAEAPASSALSGDGAISFGTMEGFSYSNPFVGLSITLNENWVTLSAEERLAANEIVATDEAEIMKALKQKNTVYLFYAQEINNFNSIKIKADKLGADAVKSININEKLGEKRDEVRVMLEKMSARDITAELSTITVAGKTIPAAVSKGTIFDNTSTQIDFLIKSGDYLITVTVMAYTDSAEILNMFSAL